MNINYELYKVFYEVVINGSISKASESMYISQPAVTQSIKNLEEKLGGKLLIRTKKGIVLTEEGKVLFDYIKKGVENFKNGENAFLNYLNLDSGSIRIGASTTITRNIVMPYLEKFHIKYPKVDIKITNDLTSNLVTALRNGDLDLLVVNLPMEENKDLKVIPICEVQDIFVGNLDYYNKTKGQIKIEDLFNYPLITQKEPSNTRRFLNKYYSDYTVIEVFTRTYLDNIFRLRDYLKSRISNSNLIFFQSGYCTQDLGGREDFMHQAVIQDFPNNQLVMLPQTVLFKNKDRKAQASAIYDAHKQLLFLARDQASYEMAKEMFPHIPVDCFPDIVTTLIGYYEYSFVRDGVLFCIRNDKEKFYSDEEIGKLMEKFQGITKCKRLDTTIHVSSKTIRMNLAKYIESYFQEFAKYKLIITDRYHGTIFSLIANTPVIVLKTTDHKVKTGVDWFKGVYDDGVYYAETLDDAWELSLKILQNYAYKRNDSYFEEKYYSKLWSKIEATFMA